MKGLSATQRAGRYRPGFRSGEFHLSAAQLRRLIDAGRNLRDRVLLQMLAETGIRRGEVAAVGVSDIQWEDLLVLIRHGKGGKSRLVPITVTLVARLATLIAGRRDGAVFTSARRDHLSGKQVNRIVAGAGERAGIRNPNPKHKQVTCHLIRHSFARLWKQKGGSIETLSKILGHASVKTTLDVYGTESLSDVQRNYAVTITKVFESKK